MSVKPKPYEIPELNGKKYIIYSGTLSERMGLRQYLHLIKRLREGREKDICLLLTGHLWEITEEELLMMIKQEDLIESVIYKNWIPYENLLSVVSSNYDENTASEYNKTIGEAIK